MNIDWSKAPEGATHWDTGLHGRTPGWMRLDGTTWHWWPVDGAKCERKWFVCCETYPSETKEFVARPPAWTGEGLPPVGTICERRTMLGGDGRYEQVIIIAHTSKGFPVWESTDAMFAGISKEAMFSNGIPSFRPIRTPEQIAADERLHEIRNALSVINSKVHFPNDLVRGNILAAAVEAMIDAGYRKPVTP
jgi:hypothetical protein